MPSRPPSGEPDPLATTCPTELREEGGGDNGRSYTFVNESVGGGVRGGVSMGGVSGRAHSMFGHRGEMCLAATMGRTSANVRAGERGWRGREGNGEWGASSQEGGVGTGQQGEGCGVADLGYGRCSGKEGGSGEGCSGNERVADGRSRCQLGRGSCDDAGGGSSLCGMLAPEDGGWSRLAGIEGGCMPEGLPGSVGNSECDRDAVLSQKWATSVNGRHMRASPGSHASPPSASPPAAAAAAAPHSGSRASPPVASPPPSAAASPPPSAAAAAAAAAPHSGSPACPRPTCAPITQKPAAASGQLSGPVVAAQSIGRMTAEPSQPVSRSIAQNQEGGEEQGDGGRGGHGCGGGGLSEKVKTAPWDACVSLRCVGV